MNVELKARVLGFLRAHEHEPDCCGWPYCGRCGKAQGTPMYSTPTYQYAAHDPTCAWMALVRDVEAEPVDVAGRGPTIYSGTDGTSEVR